MPASICSFILTFSALCGSRVVSGVLNAPTNVRLTSDDMDLVLRWDPPEGAASGLVYTTGYKSKIASFRTGCRNISALKCDFTHFNVSVYGKYFGRVRAELGAESSSWVESNHITMDKDTSISPPNVSLSSHGASLEVSIEEPVFKISTLRNVWSLATYNITYWKDGSKEKVGYRFHFAQVMFPVRLSGMSKTLTSIILLRQEYEYGVVPFFQAKSISNLLQNRVSLSNLDPWSKYCVQVQIDTYRNRESSKSSSVVCESTTNEESIWKEIVVAIVIMAVVVALVVVVVVTVVYWKHIPPCLCPNDLCCVCL